MVRRIGGHHVEVEALIGPGQTPHSFSITPRQMVRLAGARLLLTIGVDFERGVLPRIQSACPRLEIVDTRAGVPLRYFHHHAGHAHAGEAQSTTDRGAPDPHVWLDPVRAKTIAVNIWAALAAADAEHADEFARNLAAFQHELEQVDAEIRQKLAPFAGRTIYVYHPAYGYFAERYRLRQVAIEVDGKPPGAQQLGRIIADARRAGVRAVFYEPQINPSGAEAIAGELGARAVPLDALAGDYIANLRRMAAAIANAWER